MGYDAPLVPIPMELPDLPTNPAWVAADVKEYFTQINTWAGSKETEIDALQAANTDWADYMPALANLVVGNGVQVAKWRRRGQRVDVFYALQFGTTSAIGGGPTVAFPPIAEAPWLSAAGSPVTPSLGRGQAEDVSATSAGRFSMEILYGAGVFRLGTGAISGGFSQWASLTNVVPFAWSNGVGNLDRLSFFASYPTV